MILSIVAMKTIVEYHNFITSHVFNESNKSHLLFYIFLY